jgi:protein-disulfide isomerase
MKLGRQKYLFMAAAAAFAGLVVAGCQRQDESLKHRLDSIDKRLTSIEESLQRGVPSRPGAQQQPQQPQRPPEPDPSKVYSVPIEGAPVRGGQAAKVTIVEASTFSCPFCYRVAPTLNQILEEYGDDVRIAYKHFIIHPQMGTIPGQAACAAHKQGKFEPMKDLIWEKGFNAGRNLGQDNMETLARELGLNMDKFKADMEGECRQVMQRDQAELSRVGTRGTPAFYINGRYLSGARPIEQFKAIIDDELKKANERIAKGTPAERYYEEWVIKKGEKSL